MISCMTHSTAPRPRRDLEFRNCFAGSYRFAASYAALSITLLAAAPALAQDDILWFHGNGGTTIESSAYSGFVASSLGGSVDFRDDWSNLSLSDYRYVILARPSIPLDSTQVADIAAYRASGGYLVVAGDSAASGIAQIDSINTLMHDLGLGMRLDAVSHSNDVDAQGDIECRLTEVVNTGILAPSNPLSMRNNGGIDTTAGGTIILN